MWRFFSGGAAAKEYDRLVAEKEKNTDLASDEEFSRKLDASQKKGEGYLKWSFFLRRGTFVLGVLERGDFFLFHKPLRRLRFICLRREAGTDESRCVSHFCGIATIIAADPHISVSVSCCHVCAPFGVVVLLRLSQERNAFR